MFSVFKLEWKRLFGRVSSVVCFSLLIFLTGVFSAVIHLTLASANIAYSLQALLLPMAILATLPILLRGHREGEAGRAHLATLPISPSAVYFGRFLCDLSFLLLSSVIYFVLPVLLSMFGTVNIALSYTSLGAYLLLGSFFIAAAEALNLLFSRTWVRFCVLYGGIGVAYTVYRLLIFVELPHLAESLLSAPNPFCAFEELNGGSLSFPALLTLLAFLAGAIYIAFASRIGKAAHSHFHAPIAAGLALFISISSAFLPFAVSLSGEETFSVSGTTKDALRALEEDVRIYYLVSKGKSGTDKSLASFLQRYTDESEHISVSVIDTEKESAFYTAYTDKVIGEHSLIVESDRRYYVIDSSTFYHYYNAELNQNFSTQYYARCIAAFEHYVDTGEYGEYDASLVEIGSTLYYSTDTTAYFDGDALLCNAIRYVTSPHVPTVYLCGNQANSADATMQSFLSSNGYFLRTLKDLTVIPEDCALLFLYAPKKDLSDREAQALSDYLAEGGDLFLSTSCDSVDLPRLFSITEQYGMDVLDDSNIVCERISAAEEYSERFYAAVTTSAAATGSFDDKFVLLVPHAIVLKETDGVKHTEWIYTSQNARLKYGSGEPDPDSAAKYICGAIAERGNTRIFWVASPLALDLQGYVLSSGGNYQLMLSAFDWATETAYTPLSIAPSAITSTVLSITSGEMSLWGIVLSFLLPLAVILPLSVRLYVRRKK